MTTNQYSDIEVIQKILGGDVAVFEILVRRNNPFLYKIGRTYNYSHEDTQDLMQDSFMDAYANLSKFENRSTFKTWIIRIMLNNCYKRQQKFSFKNETSYEIGDKPMLMFLNEPSVDANKNMINKELGSIIENAMSKMPLDYRMVFSLREINGLNVSETAEAIGISESNVKVRLNRAKALLRKEIEKTYSSEEIFEFHLSYCNAMVKRVMCNIKNSSK